MQQLFIKCHVTGMEYIFCFICKRDSHLVLLIYLNHKLLESEVWDSHSEEDVFWVVTLCGVDGGCRHFRGTYCLHLRVDVSRDGLRSTFFLFIFSPFPWLSTCISTSHPHSDSLQSEDQGYIFLWNIANYPQGHMASQHGRHIMTYFCAFGLGSCFWLSASYIFISCCANSSVPW